MATDKNVPPMDSFESDNKAFTQDARVEVRDSLLSGVVNPARGEDRVSCEQNDTHTWAPGGSGQRRSGHGHMAGPTDSESAARVPSRLA